MSFGTVLGAGAMINWLTVENADVPLFEDWYNFEHLPERVSTPSNCGSRPKRSPNSSASLRTEAISGPVMLSLRGGESARCSERIAYAATSRCQITLAWPMASGIGVPSYTACAISCSTP